MARPPARVVVYYVLALALFADSSYEEVMRQLVEGLSWESPSPSLAWWMRRSSSCRCWA